jgi:Concanavalin A-like lectin/glucanases superfamily
MFGSYFGGNESAQRTTIPRRLLLSGAGLTVALLLGAFITSNNSSAAPASAAKAAVWTFDRTDRIGGHKTTILGHPKVIETPLGKAVEFNGRDDALFVDVHPLAGASAFTWEVMFKPYSTGAPAQRFFHLQEQDPKTGADTDTRMLFEIRIINNAWCLDSFALSGKESRALMNRKALHPLDQWYHVAAVYDGKEYRNYVNGIIQGAGPLHLAPQGPGHSSMGVRINKVDYFNGAIRMSRFTRHALTPDQFLKLPAAANSH